jgi:alkylhydroperoxidase family enzyme
VAKPPPRTPARIPPLPPEEWAPEVEEVLRPLRGFMGGRTLNIFATLAHHPKLLRSWLGFGNHVLGASTLPARERELAILRVGWLCRSDYEWGQHVLLARRVGIGDAEIARVAAGPDAPGWSPREAAVLRAADELWGDARIGDASWAELARHFEVQQLLDLVFTVGQYALVSMALNSCGVERDPGVPGFEETAGAAPAPARR